MALVTQLSEGTTTSSDTQQGISFLKVSLWGYGGPNCDANITALRTSATDLTPTFATTSTGDANIAANVVKSEVRPDWMFLYLNPLQMLSKANQGMQPNPTTGEGLESRNPDYVASLHKQILQSF